MRAKQPTHPQVPATACREGGRPGRGWLPRPRAVAAGGALLVQLWGVGLGTGCAQATTAVPATPGPAAATAQRAAARPPVPLPAQRTPQRPAGAAADPAAVARRGPVPVRPGDSAGPSEDTGSRSAGSEGAGAEGAESEHSGSGDLVGGLTGPDPLLEHPATPVDRVLQERIRAGGLPLPGQGTSVPDAFAIAAVLLPAAPAEPHEGGPRASRDAPGEAAAEAAVEPGVPAAAPSSRPGAAAPAAEVVPAADVRPGGLPPGGPLPAARKPVDAAPAGPARPEPPQGPGLTASAGSPVGVGTAGTGAAVLVPITAGLLLTAAAMCKHRGLPRGH